MHVHESDYTKSDFFNDSQAHNIKHRYAIFVVQKINIEKRTFEYQRRFGPLQVIVMAVNATNKRNR